MFLFFVARTHVVAPEIPLDSDTYSNLCANTDLGRYTSTFGIVYPCALLMVIVKLNRLKL
jgi:hypothetical protein